MPISDPDMVRAARAWMSQHGDAAIPKARAMLEKMVTLGDVDRADFWVQLIMAISELDAAPTQRPH